MPWWSQLQLGLKSLREPTDLSLNQTTFQHRSLFNTLEGKMKRSSWVNAVSSREREGERAHVCVWRESTKVATAKSICGRRVDPADHLGRRPGPSWEGLCQRGRRASRLRASRGVGPGGRGFIKAIRWHRAGVGGGGGREEECGTDWLQAAAEWYPDVSLEKSREWLWLLDRQNQMCERRLNTAERRATGRLETFPRLSGGSVRPHFTQSALPVPAHTGPDVAQQ